jgi:hypothetical protein
MIDLAGGLWDVSKEFSRFKARDKRLVARVNAMMGALAACPQESFPKAMRSSKALKGLYRFVNSPGVDHEELFDSHVRNTIERAQAAQDVLAIHDTTKFKYPNLPADEVGELSTGKSGFLAHATLLVDANAERCPLGVVELSTIHRDPGRQRRGAMSGFDCAKLQDKESARWFRGAQQTEWKLAHRARVIHIMDREGDSYELYAQLLEHKYRFVIRGDDRTCLFEGEHTRIKEALSKQRIIAEREVTLERRTTKTKAPRSVRAVREARVARLTVAGCTLTLKKPHALGASAAPKQITLNAVRVFEPDPPEGAEPVEWFLLTTEPIETDEQLLRVVDMYRHRWVIEEFFKALKTGCEYEKRGLESREGLLVALVLFLPIACQILWLRGCSRTQPNAPADGLVNETQEQIIRHFSPRKLPPRPTVRELVWAIAAMGGHQKNNGEPGWQILGYAWQRILSLEEGWRAAVQTSRKL